MMTTWNKLFEVDPRLRAMTRPSYYSKSRKGNAQHMSQTKSFFISNTGRLYTILTWVHMNVGIKLLMYATKFEITTGP